MFERKLQVSPSKTNKLVRHLLNDDYNAAVAPDEKVELTLTLAAICVLYEEETGQLTGNFWEYHVRYLSFTYCSPM